jgi:long-chain acyl-CoA synthetase
LWESIASTIQVKIADTDPIKRLTYRFCLPIGQKIFQLKLEGKKINLPLKIMHKLAWLVLFQPLLDKLGLSKVRFAYTGGTVLSPETSSFMGALGLGLRQVYGSTEAGAIAGHNSCIKPHTLGEPLPGVEVKIINGEIVGKSPGVFQGYYKNPEESARVLKGGWIYTGDAGFFDKDGHLVFMDRVSELLELPDGERFSPQFIESTLRFSPFIKDAIIFGGSDKPYICAVLVIDYENAGKWAEDHKVAYTTFADLSQKDEIYSLIQKEVGRTNELLPTAAKMKKFVNLHKEFDPDEDELTRTRKLRRRFMEERYKELVGAIYSDKEEIIAETNVKYRDGRTAKITTSVNIKSLD